MMNLAIQCLGFAVYTESKGWGQLKELKTALVFIEGLINSYRPMLAFDTFKTALRKREKDIAYVGMLKQVHGRNNWISKRIHPYYHW